MLELLGWMGEKERAERGCWYCSVAMEIVVVVHGVWCGLCWDFCWMCAKNTPPAPQDAALRHSVRSIATDG